MLKTTTFAALALALCFTTTTAGAQPPPTAPAAAPSGDAQAHFQRALELYQEQDFAGALVEFRRAQEIAPSYKMLYNIGQVCFQLTDYACALRSFEQYLKDGGSQIASERRTEVEKELSKLRARVGKLEIVTNIPDVEVAVDDVVVGKTPLPSSVVVSSGKRRVTGTHDGFAPVSRVVEVAGTDAARVELTFVSATGPVAASGAPRRESRWNTVSWIGLGAAAAFGITSGVTGGIALKASHDLDNERYAAGSGPTQKMQDDSDRAKHFAIVSDVFMGVAIATFAGTLIYTFVHKPRVIETAQAKRTFDLGISPAGAALRGSF